MACLVNTITILGVPFRILQVNKRSEVTDDANCTEVVAHIIYDKAEIRIYRGDRAERDLWVSLLHEIVHRVAEELAIKPLADDEEAITRLSAGLACVLLENELLPKTLDMALTPEVEFKNAIRVS